MRKTIQWYRYHCQYRIIFSFISNGFKRVAKTVNGTGSYNISYAINVPTHANHNESTLPKGIQKASALSRSRPTPEPRVTAPLPIRRVCDHLISPPEGFGIASVKETYSHVGEFLRM